MKGTAADAVAQECGEFPLCLRRKQALLRFISKVQTCDTNPAAEIMVDSWRTK